MSSKFRTLETEIVLYHIPSFRRTIFNTEVCEDSEEFNALKRTFALMKETSCSWIDPKEFVKLFRAKMPDSSSTQQVQGKPVFEISAI